MIRLSVSGFHTFSDASAFVLVAPRGVGVGKNIVMTGPTSTISGVVRGMDPLVVEGVANISATASAVVEGWNQATKTLATPFIHSSYADVFAAIEDRPVYLDDVVSAVRRAGSEAEASVFRRDALPFEVVVEGLTERALIADFPAFRPEKTTTFAYVAGVADIDAAFTPGSAARRVYDVASAVWQAYRNGNVAVSLDNDVSCWHAYVNGVRLIPCAMTVAPHWTEGVECRLIDRGFVSVDDVRRIDRAAGSDIVHVAIGSARRNMAAIEAKSPSFSLPHIAAYATYAAAVIAPAFGDV